MLHTTFALLKEAEACEDRYKHLAKALGGVTKYGKHTPITLVQILETNGLSDALWALRAVPEDQKPARDRLARLLACDYAERRLPIFEAKHPDDLRPRQAIEVARRYANGDATLAAAWAAARAAAGDAWAAWAARDGWAAWAARDAGDAADAAWVAAWAAAGDAERQAQADMLRRALEGAA